MTIARPLPVDRPSGAISTLTVVLAVLMATQAGLGLLFPGQYRDRDWIAATWFGNDWITGALAVPLLLAGFVPGSRGSVRGLLLWFGMLAYAIYNYAFYLFGAALNAFFLLYIAPLVVAGITLILALARVDPAVVAQHFAPGTPVRAIGGYLVFVALGLTGAWTFMWAGYAFGGRPLPVDAAAFQIVAALDLSLMVPALALGGVLLWNRRPWGYLIAAIASIQGALYLLVLSVNAVVAIDRGFAEAPGELPTWGGLAVLTTAAAVAILAHVRPDRAPVWRPAPAEPTRQESDRR